MMLLQGKDAEPRKVHVHSNYNLNIKVNNREITLSLE